MLTTVNVAPALAAPDDDDRSRSSNGAEVSAYSECGDFGRVGEACIKQRSRSNSVNTPSGIIVYQGSGTLDLEGIEEPYYSSTSRDQQVVVFRPDGGGVQHTKSSEEITLNGTTCTREGMAQVVNGEVVRDTGFDEECTSG